MNGKEILQHAWEAAHDHLPPRGLWAAHFVVQDIGQWLICQATSVGTFTHITITLYPSRHVFVEGIIEGQLRMILDACPTLQSLVFRDARRARPAPKLDLPACVMAFCAALYVQTREEIEAAINDSRLRAEPYPPGFDWEMDPDDLVETFTRSQWEDAVEKKGTEPWETS